MNRLGLKFFNSIIPGQNVIIINSSSDTQVSKISNIYPQTLSVTYTDKSEDSKAFNFKKFKFKRIRKLQATENCNEYQAFCLPREQVNNMINNSNMANMGFKSQLNKNKNIPVETNSTRSIFSESSMNFTLSFNNDHSNAVATSAEGDEKRYLSSDNQEIYYEIRLKLPKRKTEAEEIGNTACAQYDNNKIPDAQACQSWYDNEAFEVVCQCQKQGLTVNVMDNVLSNVGKLAQFPALNANICKLNYEKLFFYLLKYPKGIFI